MIGPIAPSLMIWPMTTELTFSGNGQCARPAAQCQDTLSFRCAKISISIIAFTPMVGGQVPAGAQGGATRAAAALRKNLLLGADATTVMPLVVIWLSALAPMASMATS